MADKFHYIRQYVDDKYKAIESSVSSLSGFAKSYQANVFSEVISLINTLDVVGGNLIPSQRNFNTIEEILERLQLLLNGSEYEQGVRFFLQDLDKLNVLTTEFLARSIDNFSVTDNMAALYRNTKTNALNLLIGDESIHQALYRPISEQIQQSISSGASLRDLTGSLRTVLEGLPDQQGILERYVGQISYDAMATGDRAFGKQAADDLGLNWFRYSGGLITTSRPFCRERDGKFFHRSEIEKWPNLDWAGKYKGVNSSTIYVWVGGYRCQHDLMPVSEGIVPKTDLQRIAT